MSDDVSSEVHVLSDVTYREFHPGWVGKLKGCAASSVVVTQEMLGDCQPDIHGLIAQRHRQARIELLAEVIEHGEPLPPFVTIGEYREAATLAGVPAEAVESEIVAGTAYLADLLAGLD